jgi:hypothetical protein
VINPPVAFGLPAGFFYGLTKSPGAILDAERVCAWRARRAEGQDGPSKGACGAFSERALTRVRAREQKARLLLAKHVPVAF